VLAKALSRRQPSWTQTNRAIYARIFTAANTCTTYSLPVSTGAPNFLISARPQTSVIGAALGEALGALTCVCAQVQLRAAATAQDGWDDEKPLQQEAQ
jgi:hypothetical protein